MAELTLTNVVDFYAMFIVLAAVFGSVFQIQERKPFIRLIFILACTVTPLIVIGNLRLAQHFQSLAGDLSVMSVVLLSTSAFSRFAGREIFGRNEWNVLMAGIALLGLFVYTTAFGLNGFEAYSLGFGSGYVAIALLGAVIACIFFRYLAAAFCLLICIASYHLGLLETNNLIDYLIDPFLMVYSLISVSSIIIRKIRG